ncbi:MAG: UDP-3-O-(3-hydroxymyristoyl)glucosamine N-acyltransferase [Vicingaceae bacterium]
MNFSAAQIAEILGGKVDGDASVEVNRLSKIEEGEPNSLTFLANPKYTPFIYDTKASIVIVQEDFMPERELNDSCTLIRVNDAYSSFGKLLELYDTVRHPENSVSIDAQIPSTSIIGQDCYIASGVQIGENVKIGNRCKIYPGAYIGDNVVIGNESILYAGVTVYLDCKIGESCVLHAGVVIGGDGFGFSPSSENHFQKLPQIGNVLLEDNVEIGANSCVDRATLGSTFIRKGVKIDNLVQIGHNAEIGENTVIAAQTGVAGSARIGKNCMIGGQVGIAGHLTIGDNVKIAAQSGIGSSIENDAVVQGSPAFAIGQYQRSYVGFRRLPKLISQLNELQKAIQKNIKAKHE